MDIKNDGPSRWTVAGINGNAYTAAILIASAVDRLEQLEQSQHDYLTGRALSECREALEVLGARQEDAEQ